MLMNYITIKRSATEKFKEVLVAVAGNEKDAQELIDLEECAPFDYRIRTLNQLFDNKVVIPKGLQWIVESDRKHQAREVDNITKNIVDDNALSFKKKKELAAQHQQDNESFFPPQK